MKYSLKDEVYIVSLTPEGSLDIVKGTIVGIVLVATRIKYIVDPMQLYAKDIQRYEEEIFRNKEEIIKRIEDEFTRY